MVNISIVFSVKLLETCYWVDVDIVFLFLLSVMLHGGGVLGIGSKYAVVADKRWGGGTIPIVARGRRETKIDWFPTSVVLIKHRCCISYVDLCFEDVASVFVASLFSCCILLTEN